MKFRRFIFGLFLLLISMITVFIAKANNEPPFCSPHQTGDKLYDCDVKIKASSEVKQVSLDTLTNVIPPKVML